MEKANKYCNETNNDALKKGKILLFQRYLE